MVSRHKRKERYYRPKEKKVIKEENRMGKGY